MPEEVTPLPGAAGSQLELTAMSPLEHQSYGGAITPTDSEGSAPAGAPPRGRSPAARSFADTRSYSPVAEHC